MLKMLSLPGLLTLGFIAAAAAETTTIQIDHCWARASVTKTGAVYMTIRNAGSTDDRLLAVATPVADRAQLHIEMNDNGIMKMRPLSAVDVKANSTVALAPGGIHVMLTGLKQPLKVGQSFPITLTFEKAGKLQVTVATQKAGATNAMAK